MQQNHWNLQPLVWFSFHQTTFSYVKYLWVRVKIKLVIIFVCLSQTSVYTKCPVRWLLPKLFLVSATFLHEWDPRLPICGLIAKSI